MIAASRANGSKSRTVSTRLAMGTRAVMIPSERIPDRAVRQAPPEQPAELLDQPTLQAVTIPHVPAASLRDLRLLEMGHPEQLLGRRVPGQVHLVQPVVV